MSEIDFKNFGNYSDNDFNQRFQWMFSSGNRYLTLSMSFIIVSFILIRWSISSMFVFVHLLHSIIINRTELFWHSDFRPRDIWERLLNWEDPMIIVLFAISDTNSYDTLHSNAFESDRSCITCSIVNLSNVHCPLLGCQFPFQTNNNQFMNFQNITIKYRH